MKLFLLRTEQSSYLKGMSIIKAVTKCNLNQINLYLNVKNYEADLCKGVLVPQNNDNPSFT